MNTFGIEWLQMDQTKQTDPNNPCMGSVISNLRFTTGAGPEIPDEVLLRAYYDGGGYEAECDSSVSCRETMLDLLAEYEEHLNRANFQGPWVVSFCMAAQSYGGPEEGGWWYTTFDPNGSDVWEINKEHDALRVFWVREEAVKFMQTMFSIRDAANKGRPPIHSVRSSGVFEVRIYEGWPCYEPKVRPHYE